jgi:site-specific DNA recombinase
LVSKQLFEAAAEQLEENRMRNRQRRRGARWLLQGLIVCRHCGYALYGTGVLQRRPDGTSSERGYYRCLGRNGHRWGGQALCDNRPVSVSLLDKAVWQDVCDLLRNPGKVHAEYQRRLHHAEEKSTPLSTPPPRAR